MSWLRNAMMKLPEEKVTLHPASATPSATAEIVLASRTFTTVFLLLLGCALPRRRGCFQDPFERDRRSLGHTAHRLFRTGETAQHHLVLSHEQRPQVLDSVAVHGQLCRTLRRALIQRVKIRLVNPRPETLGEEFGRVSLRHDGNAGRSTSAWIEGNP
jgi:hypothetical protein